MTIGAPPVSGVTTRVEQFGRYTLFGKIAAGGMASVYLARESEGDVDTWFAIKRVHPHLATRTDVLQMFMNEAKILSRLDHQNICGITDYGIHEDTPYLVMRYLHGAPLSGLLRTILDQKNPIPVDLMAYVIASTCEGLHYAHDATGEDGNPLGLVHRDISPQNIFVTFAGDVKLLDFGVAKAAGFQSFTRTGHIKGKYAYMSPEQVEAAKLDRRSDVFSLGIVLWEMLTGRHLFKRKREIDTLRAITRAVVPAASELNPNVPQGLDAIVAKALVAGCAHRHQSAEDMGRALWAYLTAAERPMGSDEVAEIMISTFPDKPPPSEIAQINTQPDGLAIATTSERAPITEEGSGPRSDSSTDPPVPWSSVTPPRGVEDPTVPLHSRDVQGTVQDGLEMEETPMVEDPPSHEAETGDIPRVQLPDDEAGSLIEYRVDDALHSPTIADPNLARDARAATVGLETIPPDQVVDVDDYNDATERAEPLLERPAVSPHPFDEPGVSLLDTDDVRDTILNDALPQKPLEEAGPNASAAMVVTTIPKAEISELPPEPRDAGPTIEPPPPSLIDDQQFEEPPRRSWPDAPIAAPRRGSAARWLAVMLVLLVTSAGVAYWVTSDLTTTVDEIPPSEDLLVEETPPPAPIVTPKPPTPTPTDAKALFDQGQRALVRTELDEAEKHLTACIEASPNFARCHRALGVLYARRRDTLRSLKHYETYLELAPDAPDANRVREMVRAARPKNP